MDVPQHILTLIPAPDEPPDANLQHDQNKLDEALNANATSIQIRRSTCGHLPVLGAGSFLTSVLATAAALGPSLGTALGAWLHARYGRKVRLKIGEIEAEAQTPEEVEKLIAQALEIQLRKATKIIQGP